MRWIKRGGLVVVILFVVAMLMGLGVLVYEGKRKPDTTSRYVALGSSFAAGLGLGERAPGSPFACQRSVNSYPQHLARSAGISISDETCSGATVKHVLHGGQLFQGPQIDAIGPHTELVTLTAGGNDIDYVGDLVAISYQRRGGMVGFITKRFWHGAKPAEERAFAELQGEMVATLQQIAQRAPHARTIVITYPVIIPPTDTCAALGIDESEASRMREVGVHLADVTRAAAKATGATLVDMHTLSAGHDACSPEPWVSGAAPEQGAPFHPTLAGAKATAQQILLALR